MVSSIVNEVEIEVVITYANCLDTLTGNTALNATHVAIKVA
jgi:hypothetical protein